MAPRPGGPLSFLSTRAVLRRRTRLVFNVVLEGRGVVYLGPLELTHLNTADFSGMSGGSVSRVAGMAGGIAGAVVGCVGALIGLLTSLGRARRFVIAVAMSFIAVGATSFIAGMIAFAWSQPYSLFYPLLLVGFIACIVPLGLLSSIRRRYEEIELRGRCGLTTSAEGFAANGLREVDRFREGARRR